MFPPKKRWTLILGACFLAITSIMDSKASTWTTEPGQPAWISSPYGQMRGRTAEGLCAAEKIFIGKTTNVYSFETPVSIGTKTDKTIRSKLKMTVEHVYLGSFGSKTTMEVPGGKVGTLRVISTGPFPSPEIGKRYLIGLTSLKTATGGKPVGFPIYTAVLELDSGPLPSASNLNSYFTTFTEANCE